MPRQLNMRTAAEIAGYLNHGNFNHYTAVMESLAAANAIPTSIPGKGFEVLTDLGDVLALDPDVSLDVVAAEVIEVLEPAWTMLRDKIVAARWLLDAPAECHDLTKDQCAMLCAKARVAAYFEPIWLEETRTREVRITGVADADVQKLLPVQWNDDAGVASLMTAAGCPPDFKGRYVERDVKERIKIANHRPKRPDAIKSKLSRTTHSQADASQMGGYMLDNDPSDFKEIWDKLREYAKLRALYNDQNKNFSEESLWKEESRNKVKRKQHSGNMKKAWDAKERTHESLIEISVDIEQKRLSNKQLSDFYNILFGRSYELMYTTSNVKNNGRLNSLILPSFQASLRLALHRRNTARDYAGMLEHEGLPIKWQGPPDLREIWSETQKDLRRALRRLRQWYALFYPKKHPDWEVIYKGENAN